jgi:D-3-phosphoglycerate dehydrogenase
MQLASRSYWRLAKLAKSTFKVVRLNAHSYPVFQFEKDELAKIGAELICIEGSTPNEIIEVARDADALFVVAAKVRKEVIEQLYKCRVIARVGTGVDNIDVDVATEKGILVTNVPDFCLSEMADHTMALLLGVARKIVIMDRRTRNCEWSSRINEHLKRVDGKSLGLVGFGRIARAVALRAKPFGLKIFAFDPYVKKADFDEYSVEPVTLQFIVANCDFISLHVPLNRETYHMIGEKELRTMKPSTILINSSRGAIVDEQVLIKALSEGWIAGAGIDVFEKINVFDESEKKVYSPLFSLENVILSPHAGGCSDESLVEVKQKALREVISVLSRKWPQNCVNPTVVPRYPLTT